MAKLTSLHASKTKRILLYGAPKTGKTKLAAELAEKFKVLYIGLENGHDTLFQLPEAWQQNIEVLNIPDSRSYPIGIETMLKIIKGVPVKVCEEHGKVGCPICAKDPNAPVMELELQKLGPEWVVIVDSLSQLTNSAISFITKGKPDTYKLQTDDWGDLGKLMDMFLSHVQVARYNIICISHETAVEMQDGKEKLVATAGTRNFSRNSAKYFDEVIYCEMKNKKHTFGSATSYANNIVTGSRGNFELESFEDPKLLYLWHPELGRKKEKKALGT